MIIDIPSENKDFSISVKLDGLLFPSSKYVKMI